MRTHWDANEKVEHNPFRWVARRWVRLSLLERAITLAPLLLWALGRRPTMAALALLVILSFGLAVAFVSRPGFSGHRSRRPLSDDVPGIEEMDVDVVIERDGVATGEDWGRLALVDGWLVFNGNRTTFALQRSHCGPILWDRPSWDGARIRSRRWAVLYPFGAFETIRVRSVKGGNRLENLAEHWHRERVVGEPTLPPSAPHPEAYTQYRLRLAWWAVVVVVYAILAFDSHGPVPIFRSSQGLFGFTKIYDWIVPIWICYSALSPFLAIRKLRLYARSAREDSESMARPAETGPVEQRIEERVSAKPSGS